MDLTDMTINLDLFNNYLNEYNYTFIFEFERRYFNYELIKDGHSWIRESWHMSFFYSVIYLVLTLICKKLMQNREKTISNSITVTWNFCLALFSLIGTMRFLPHFIFVLQTKGFTSSICLQDYAQGVTACWSWLFVLSKYAELFDTLLIVLRKKNLLFLHCYHHIIVLIYCWFSTRDFISTGRWFILFNYITHTFMYTYYAIRATGINLPIWINKILIICQIFQMIIGLMVNYVAYLNKIQGRECHVKYSNIYFSLLMYFSFFLFFLQIFYNSYIQKPSASKIKQPLLKNKRKMSKNIKVR